MGSLWVAGPTTATLPPCGKSMDGWSGYPPAPFPYPSFPAFSKLGIPNSQTVPRNPATSPRDATPPTPRESDETPGTSSSLHRNRSQDAQDDEDSIHLLDEAEALELVEFDPSVEPKDTWNPPSSMVNFLEKHFN